MGSNKKFRPKKFWHYLPFGFFVAAILCLCFAYGVAVGKWHLFPHGTLDAGLDALRDLRYRGAPPHNVVPARYDGEGVVVNKPDRACPGVTFLTGVWKNEDGWSKGLRLINLEGDVLHEWRCNPLDLWPESPHKDWAEGGMINTTFIHGSLLLPDGEVVLSFGYYGLVKLDTQSNVVWKLPYRTHHSVFQDDGGKLWVCGAKWYENRDPDYPCLKPPFLDDIILKVSPDGIIEREISLLKTMYRSGYDGLIFVNRTRANSCYNTRDVLHLNDVEVLSKRKAQTFDLFEAGDIMVSMRHLSTVLVIDGKTERVKWSMTHPFVAQHDPDFTEDGYITVFDNHTNEPDPGSEIGGSRILRVEPSTREVMVLYGRKGDQYFWSFKMGKHQNLPNGNLLISEAQAGRVFEVTPDGEVVWDWLSPRWDKNRVLEIPEGTRYSSEFASFVTGLREEEK